MFESGAIVLQIAERSEALMPRDAAGRARATTWVLAALNSVEPAHMELATIDFFHPDAEWAAARRPEVERKIRARTERLYAWLGEKDYLEDRLDRTSDVRGKRVSVRVDLGGRRRIKKNKHNANKNRN